MECGAQLEPVHHFCWNCGARRWSPPDPAANPPTQVTEPPTASPAPAAAPTTAVRPKPAGRRAELGVLPWLYAGGAVFFLVWGTQALALVVAPAGRSQLLTEMGRQGVPANARPTLLLLYGALLIGAAVAAAGLHAAAFYGLRRMRWWGWLAAVVVAGFWSLLIVGLPVLLRLVSRNVREAFGVD